MRENAQGISMGFFVLFFVLLVVLGNAFVSKASALATDDPYHEEEAESEYGESGDDIDVEEDEYVEEEFSEEESSVEYVDAQEQAEEEYGQAPLDMDEEPLPEEASEEEPVPGARGWYQDEMEE